MAHSPDDLAEFFRVRKIGFGRCLEPAMQCAQPAIRAHSIQNGQTIALLEKENHVMAWQPRFSEAGPDIALRRIGRNEASTFFGFCNRHDTDIFRPLDTKPLDIADREQLFLLAYRGITCELHAVMTGVMQLQTLYAGRVDRGVDLPDKSSPAGKKALEQMILSWAIWRYRHKHYDEALLSKTFDGIEHDIVELHTEQPCLAASSFITIKDVPLDQELVGLAINVLPLSATKTVTVFSYAPQDRGAVRAGLDRVLSSRGDTHKYELSKLILSRISNVLISPNHFDKWDATKAKKIADAFVSTAKTQRDVEDDVDFMMF